MKLTKYEHATLAIERSNETLVIDPGSFTIPLTDLRNVVGIVITHEHKDHWTPEHLDKILEMNPDATILGPAGVGIAAPGYPITVVKHGDEVAVSGFTLKFFGETHAVIHSSIPVIDNVGVLVNDTLFYPGDAFTVPPVDVDVLAVPAGAPWLKIGEVIDYIAEVRPKRVFPTHDMVLSVIGKGMANDRLATTTRAAGGEYIVLDPGQSLEL